MKNILIIGCGLLGSSFIENQYLRKKIAKKNLYVYEKSKANILKIKKIKTPMCTIVNMTYKMVSSQTQI